MSISIAMLKACLCFAAIIGTSLIGVLVQSDTVRHLLSLVSTMFAVGMFMSLQEWYKTIHIPAKRDERGECLNCGYPLHEELNRCPECGSFRESQLDS
jgi:hypothetical protein